MTLYALWARETWVGFGVEEDLPDPTRPVNINALQCQAGEKGHRPLYFHSHSSCLPGSLRLSRDLPWI